MKRLSDEGNGMGRSSIHVMDNRRHITSMLNAAHGLTPILARDLVVDPRLYGLPKSFNGIRQGERLEPRQFLETLDQPWAIRYGPFGIETFGPNGIGDLHPEMSRSLGVHHPAIAGIENERKFCG